MTENVILVEEPIEKWWRPESTERFGVQVIPLDEEHTLVVPFPRGAVVQLQHPSWCSAHWGDTRLSDEERHQLFDGVMVKNITDLEDGWHAYWWCPEHWARYRKATEEKAVKPRPATVKVTLELDICTGCFQVRSVSGACSC